MQGCSVGNELTEECKNKMEDDLGEREIVQEFFKENYLTECLDGNIPITEVKNDSGEKTNISEDDVVETEVKHKCEGESSVAEISDSNMPVADPETDSSKEKGFECQRCSAMFPQSDLLKSHMKSHGKETTEETIKEESSDRGKTDNDTPRKNKKSGFRKKKYKCRICDAKFPTIDEVKIHRKTHKNAKKSKGKKKEKNDPYETSSRPSNLLLLQGATTQRRRHQRREETHD